MEELVRFIGKVDVKRAISLMVFCQIKKDLYFCGDK